SDFRLNFPKALTDNNDCRGKISLSAIESNYLLEKHAFTHTPRLILEYNEYKAQRPSNEYLPRTKRPIYVWSLFDNFNCDDTDARGYSWIPASSSQRGPGELKELRDRAKSGRPFNSGWPYPHGIDHVIVESDDSTEAEQHLALC